MREALDLGVALLGRPEAPTQVRQHRAARVVRTHGVSSKAPTVLELVRSRVRTAFELDREVAQLRQEAVSQLRTPRSRDTRPSRRHAPCTRHTDGFSDLGPAPTFPSAGSMLL